MSRTKGAKNKVRKQKTNRAIEGFAYFGAVTSPFWVLALVVKHYDSLNSIFDNVASFLYTNLEAIVFLWFITYMISEND